MNDKSTIDKAVEATDKMAVDNNDISDRIAMVNDAISKLKDDPGAVFEKPILAALKAIRNESQPHWQRMRRKLKEEKVKLPDLENEIFDKPESLPEEEVDEIKQGVEPWPLPVNGAELLDEIKTQLTRYTVMPPGGHTAIALWILSTYVYNSFGIFPRLCLSSPLPGCGKTTAFEVIDALVNRAMMCSNISPSVIFRMIELCRPTLFLDEGDSYLHKNEELRGIINSGHKKSGAIVWRNETINGQFIPTRFSTWAPMAIAMIHTPSETIRDRSIMIHLRAKLQDEKIKRVPLDLKNSCLPLRQKFQRWANDNADILRTHQPNMPNLGSDRAEDNWLPLISVADIAGEQWPQQARMFMKTVEEEKIVDEDIGVLLLRDIKMIFDNRGTVKIFSKDLVNSLISIEDGPWGQCEGHHPLTQDSLAARLKVFKIKSKSVRLTNDNLKGYNKKQFEDAFLRYLRISDISIPSSPTYTPAQAVTTAQPSNHTASSQIQGVTNDTNVTDEKSLQPNNLASCAVVPGKTGGKPEDNTIKRKL